jgi:hypothetical protein
MTNTNPNTITSAPKGRIRLYCCGGAAINIVSQLNKIRINPDMLASFEPVQIDTAVSNLGDHTIGMETYLLPKTKGSGKDRTENLALAREHTKPILKAHPPLDLNIVLSTGAGGSGSVLAPSIVSELLAAGQQTIVLLIGVTASRREINNTRGTIKNYQEIAAARNAPVVMSYLQNSSNMPREKVNAHMLSTISYLGLLFSNRNSELDPMDLRNWLFFTKQGITSGLKPQLFSLNILLRDEKDAQADMVFENDLHNLGNVLSLATLARQGVHTDLPDGYLPEYQAVGFVPNLAGSTAFEGTSVNYLITDGLVPTIIAELRNAAQHPQPDQIDATDMDDDDEVNAVSFA